MNASKGRTVLTATEFADRVMAAISLAPMPTPTRTFVAAMRARDLRDAIASILVAWHLGTVRSWPIAPRVRARSFALVLAVTSVLATGSFAAAAAVHSVAPQRDERTHATSPSGPSVDEPGPATNGQTGTDAPDPSPSPSSEAKPVVGGSTAGQPADAGGNDAKAGDKPDGTDDNAGDHKPGPDGSGAGDDSEDGSGGGDRPAATDHHGPGDDGHAPAETDHPDGGHHSGSGGGGASGGGDAPDPSDGGDDKGDGG